MGLVRSLTPKPANTKVLNSINGNMKESTNWYWTPDLKIIRHVAQLNGISQVCECSDVAYLEAEKERLETKRQEWVEGASKATKPVLKVYFEQLLKEVDYQLEYVNQRLSELREPTELLEDKFDGQISSSKKSDSDKLLEDKLLEDKSAPDEISSSKNSDSDKLLEDKCDEKISSSKTRRHKGDGSGCIYWRTITKNGKDYQQAYYQYELWEKGVAAAHAERDRLIKSSKYIPKGSPSPGAAA